MFFQIKARAKQGLKRAALRAGYHIENVESHDFDLMCYWSLEALLYDRLDQVGSDFFFLQIGANDGVSFDWLYQFVTAKRLRGIVVEPVSDYFQELCVNYASQPQVLPVNVAIHRTAREIEIFRVDPKAKELPAWTKGIASLDPTHHLRSGTGSEYIVTEKVQCLTLAELLSHYKVTKIDYLQIDTEGYDAEILSMIDLEKIKPHIIRFEHEIGAGTMTREALQKSVDTLIQAGYYIFMTRYDAIAYLLDD